MNFRFKYLGADFLICSQAVLFSILFAIWALPETILVRNLCLMLGGCIGAYQIYHSRTFLTIIKSIPIGLIFALFIWITIHLLFFGSNFQLQYAEYSSIWKRCFLGVIFAIGFGLGLANASSNIQRVIWVIFYSGLLMPTLIYIFKFGLIYYAKLRGVSLPEYFQLFSSGVSRFYIAKTAYVGFCIPVLAVALGQLYFQISKGRWISLACLAYLMTILAVLFVFYTENIKNGLAYALVLICIFIVLTGYKNFKVSKIKISLLVAIFVLITGIFIKNHVEQNRSWQTFFADAKIAVQTDAYQNWQCTPVFGLPNNDLGEPVSVTNYERISWGINAVKLISQYPLGFGLVERSFGSIGHEKWPNSCLNQSHSGWLDLTLGIGIPGVLMLLSALIINLINLYKLKKKAPESSQSWISMLSCVLLSFLLIWCTTEISQKVFLDELIFFIALSGGFIVGKHKLLSGVT